MDTRDTKMGTPRTSNSSESDGDTNATFGSVEEFFEHIRSQSRELDMASRAEFEEVRLSNYRRKQSIQRSINEAIQSLEEAAKRLQKEIDSNRNPKPPRDV